MTPIHERIHQAIVEAQERRSRLPGHGWVVPEQVAALGEANAILAEHELPELDMATIARLEIKAPGHDDYTRKFSLSVSEHVEQIINDAANGMRENHHGT